MLRDNLKSEIQFFVRSLAEKLGKVRCGAFNTITSSDIVRIPEAFTREAPKWCNFMRKNSYPCARDIAIPCFASFPFYTLGLSATALAARAAPHKQTMDVSKTWTNASPHVLPRVAGAQPGLSIV
jgi:hypothetical protein